MAPRPSNRRTYMPPEVEARYMELAARVLRVERPRLELARVTIRGMSDPAEAWETLSVREVTPHEWIDDPLRRFAAGAFDEPRPWPPTLHTCATFAGDPAGVETAEALAREAAKRLARFRDEDNRAAHHASPPAVCVWRCIPADEWRPRDPGPADVLESALAEVAGPAPEPDDAFAVVYRRIPAGGRPADRPLLRLARDVRLAEQWRLGAQWGGSAGRPRRALADLPDPFEPLLALWSTGYALDAITDDALVMIASEV